MREPPAKGNRRGRHPQAARCGISRVSAMWQDEPLSNPLMSMSKQTPWYLLSLVAIQSGSAGRLLSQGDPVKVGIAIALLIGSAMILVGCVLDFVRRRKR